MTDTSQHLTHPSQRMPLAAHVEVYKTVVTQIAAQFGLDEDDRAVRDSAEGETDLAELLVKLLREARYAAAQAKGLAELQKAMADRKARLEHKSDRLRAIVLHAMAEAGLPKLAAPDFSASRSRAQAPLIITEPAAVPDVYCRLKREPEMAKIREALKAGEKINWAHFGEASETLTVRGS